LRVDEHRTPFAELRRILNAVRSGEILSEANRKIAANDLKGAMTQALAARDRSATNDAAWVTIANIQLRMGQKADAMAAVAKAVELNPANKKQLLRDVDFKGVRDDPAFIKIVGSN
jgi:thioredoxin-like negative regulator of GroEL